MIDSARQQSYSGKWKGVGGVEQFPNNRHYRLLKDTEHRNSNGS